MLKEKAEVEEEAVEEAVEEARERYHLTARGALLCVIGGILFTVATTLFALTVWYDKEYSSTLKELLYTIVSPLRGTGTDVINNILRIAVPVAAASVAVYVLVAFFIRRSGKKFRRARIISFLLSIVLLINSVVYAGCILDVADYMRSVLDTTTIYEEYYISPDTVVIGANGKTKNLIYIYLESMETTYASTEVGGAQDGVNYIPLLTRLAMENVSFSNKDEGLLGGFHSPSGTGWTIAAIFATTSGLPFSFPLADVNTMNERQSFASQVTVLGDILARAGYKQEFICGSDSEFGGRKLYLTQHGGYEIFDLYTAREWGYVEEDYHNKWWGYEDLYLYEIAKDEVLELASGDAPFNLTILTVDTHATDGYVCSACGDEYENKTANVIKCADSQVYEFVEWCKEQSFYEDTAIVIMGDHSRHDTALIGDIDEYDRTIYNCFINAAVEPAGSTYNREFTTMDIFPTVLAAIGFTVEGERLGLGTNMFSSTQTLAEQLGYWYIADEVSKYSEYYIENFA